MTYQELLPKINVRVKIIFKERDLRLPMIGKFVSLNDSKNLSSKGMIRFVNQSKLDYWKDDEPSIGLTKIYVVNDFSQVIPVK